MRNWNPVGAVCHLVASMNGSVVQHELCVQTCPLFHFVHLRNCADFFARGLAKHSWIMQICILHLSEPGKRSCVFFSHFPDLSLIGFPKFPNVNQKSFHKFTIFKVPCHEIFECNIFCIIQLQFFVNYLSGSALSQFF